MNRGVQNSENIAQFIGKSQLVTRMLEELDAAAATNASVLIIGESGTGKEVLRPAA